MIGVLFGINTMLALAVAFTTTMLQNHFNKIQRSMQIYLNSKAYKTESDIAFIRDLIDKYQKAYKAQNGTNIDVEAMIQVAFYEKKIGKFPYAIVQNINIKSKLVMWGILFVQISFEILSRTPGQSIPNFIFIVSSTILCVIITFLGILKSVNEKREQLFVQIQDYITNTYPTEMNWVDKQKDVKVLLERIEKLEAELEAYQEDSTIPAKEKQIKEADIKMLLSKIDLNL